MIGKPAIFISNRVNIFINDSLRQVMSATAQ